MKLPSLDVGEWRLVQFASFLYCHCCSAVRALTPEMVEWAASTGKFVFLKDPVTDVNVMNRKITAARSVKDTPLK